MMFMPQVGDFLVVSLPGEALRGVVDRVIDRDTCFVTIPQPMTRSHTFRKGDIVACRRHLGQLGEIWEALELRPPMLTPADLPPVKPAKPAEKVTRKPKPRGKRVALDRKPVRKPA